MNITLAEALHKLESLQHIIEGLERESDVTPYIYDAQKFLKEYQQLLLDTNVKI